MQNLFRDGIINLNTRQFGTVVELIVQLLKDYQMSNKSDFDSFDPETNETIEVKSSRVYRKQRLKFTLDNLYELIMNKSDINRLIVQTNATKEEFNCNIQQIKIGLFDKLYYLLFFLDTVEVFKISSLQIRIDDKINYSNKQHKGNEGEGQFHITHQNYLYHKKNYFVRSISYDEIKELLLKRKTKYGDHSVPKISAD